MKKTLPLIMIALLAISCKNTRHDTRSNPIDDELNRQRFEWTLNNALRKQTIPDIVQLLDVALLDDPYKGAEKFEELCDMLHLIDPDAYKKSIIYEQLNEDFSSRFNGAIVKVSPQKIYEDPTTATIVDVDDVTMYGLLAKDEKRIFHVNVIMRNAELFDKLIDVFDSKYEYKESYPEESSIEHIFLHTFKNYVIQLELCCYKGFFMDQYVVKYHVLGRKK